MLSWKRITLVIIFTISNFLQTAYAKSLVETTRQQNMNIILGQNAENIIMQRNVYEETNITLACYLSGNPVWYKDDRYLNANRKIFLPFIKTSDAGVYSCFTKIALHGIEWANLTLHVQKLEKSTINTTTAVAENIYTVCKNTFGKLPHNVWYQEVQADSILKLNCPAHAQPLRNISWFYHNTIIAAQNNNELESSMYSKVLDAHITLQANMLIIKQLHLSKEGLYSCRVCNMQNCIDHLYNILVTTEQNNKLSVLLRNQTILQGDVAELTCEVLPHNLASSIIWLKLNTSILNSNLIIKQIKHQLTCNKHLDINNTLPMYAQLLHRNSNNDAQKLLLKEVQLKDEGWYSCLAFNNKKFNMSSAFIQVVMPNKLKLDTKLYNEETAEIVSHAQQTDTPESERALSSEEGPPKFKKNDTLVDVKQPTGRTLDLRCAAIGNPMPNITWTRNNTEINRRLGTVKYNKWGIKMDDLITDDSGIYKCTVCNKYGCIEDSSNVTIIDRMRSPPIQSDKFPQNQTVLINGTAVFECKVVSDLEPYIYWLKYKRRNESIQELEKIVTSNITYDDKDFIKLQNDRDQTHVLRLQNVTHADEGWYTCVAANSLGRSVASAYLKVLDKLPTRELHNNLRSHPYLIIVVAVVVISLFLFVTIFIIYVLRKLKHEKLIKQRIQTVHQWTKKIIIYKPTSIESNNSDLQMPVVKIEKKRTTFQTTAGVDSTQAFNEYEFPLDSDWEIPRANLTLGVTLGEGAFGRVVKAEATSLTHLVTGTGINYNQHNNNNGQATTTVAVKMVKDEHTDADMASLVREMEVMKIIGRHVNIINLLGCCSRSDGPLWVVVEYAPHGNLKEFLKKHRPLSLELNDSLKKNNGYLQEKPLLAEKNLVSFAFQVARGMEYLSSRKCIHRDLAARNVLVSNDYVIKIADFGLARDLQDTDYYRKNSNGRLPIKWMAPESLQDKFYDSKSDVWSYGVLLWEIMSYGEQPYAHLMSAEELNSYLVSGQRMEKPPRCSINIYLLMRQCWHFDASARPTFSELVEYLEKIFQSINISSNEEYLDLSIPILETPPSSSDSESEPENFNETSPLRYEYTY